MLRQRNDQIQVIARIIDAVACSLAFFSAFKLRNSTLFFPQGGIGALDSVLWLLAACLLLQQILFPLLGFYKSFRLKSVTAIVAMIVKTMTVEFFFLGSLIFIFQAKETSRYFFSLFLVINALLLLIEKLTASFLLSTIRRRGYNYRQVLIVGTGESAAKVIDSLRRNKHWGYVPCGVLRETATGPALEMVHEVPVLDHLQNLQRVMTSRAIDEVFFAMDQLDTAKISDTVLLCEKLGVTVRFSLAMFEITATRAAYTSLDNIPVLTFYPTVRTPTQDLIKRAIDILASIVGLTLTGLLYPWIARSIRKESPGPVIFKQPRVGENGRIFKCYKFRTMYLDAELQKAELMKENQMTGPIFKIENDPRVTPFGRFLRRSSLDELPQFFNILRGDMSLVGTRPPTPDEVRQYEVHFRRRLSIRPGLTGLWQVSGRSSIHDFEDILKLDLEYIDRWSIGLDLKIIFRTVWNIFARRGAV